MGCLLLALWAFLASMEHAVGHMPDRNLSCFQCFKVGSGAKCPPAACSSSDHVCVSHEVAIYTESRIRVQISKRCAPRCPNSNGWFEWTPAPGLQVRITRSCCSAHLCNRAAARPGALWGQPAGLLLVGGLGLLTIV